MKINLISGFLGSGKTTAIQKACSILMASGNNVGVITNDQGDELVDTAYIRSYGIPVREVTAGCFCCNYNQLADELSSLRTREQPSIIFAETVGSCTDLIATVAKPLEKFNTDMSIVISVFADAAFLHSLISGKASFLNDEVRYIYKNQLMEADILVINKVDLLSDDKVSVVKDTLAKEFPSRILIFQNSLDDVSVQRYLDTVLEFQADAKRTSLTIDYDTYAEGEAMMGWFDQWLIIDNPDGRAYDVAIDLIVRVATEIRRRGLTIGHLKFLLDDGARRKKISYTTFDTNPAIQREAVKMNRVSLLINARIQAFPTEIHSIVTAAQAEIGRSSGSSLRITKQAAFQPGYPRPTHRMAD